MFNYTKEVIINDPSVIVAGSAENGLGEGVVAIKRGGNYVVNNIEGGKIYKTVGSKGTKAKAVITPVVLGETADVARLTIYLSTPGTEFVEFGSPNWQEFGKPYIIETKATTAKDLADAIKLALNEDNAHFSVKVNDTKVELEVAETWMDFAEVNYDLVTFADCSDCSKETVVSQAANVTVTHGTPEFGTAKWIVENLRFPSHPNLRYAPLYADEAPVAGTVYTEYSFEYRVKRSVPGGLSAVGQVADSIVRIVFYVAPGAQTTFENAFGVGLIDITAATPTTDGK